MASSIDQNILNDRLADLYDDEKELLENSQWSTKLSAIAQKYSVQAGDIDNLQKATLKTILGTIEPESLRNGLVVVLGLSQAIADQMMGDIKLQILIPLQDFTKDQKAKYFDDESYMNEEPAPQEIALTSSGSVPMPPTSAAAPVTSSGKTAADFLAKIQGRP